MSLTQIYPIGDSGEVIASNMLGTIFNAQVNRASLKSEFDGALDLHVEYTYFNEEVKTRRYFAVQVKTGNSHATWLKTSLRWKIDVDNKHVEKWRKFNGPIILIWIKPDKNMKVYWKYIGKNSSEKYISIGKKRLLNPGTKFEIDRLIQNETSNNKNYPLFTIKSYKSFFDALISSKRNFQKLKGIVNSSYGRIEISNYCWRHLTRNGRKNKYIRESLALLPITKPLLLKDPSKIITQSETSNIDDVSSKGEVTVRKKILFIYRNVNFSNQKKAHVFIRLDETIIFPKNWQESGLLQQNVIQKMKLESIYKKEK